VLVKNRTIAGLAVLALASGACLTAGASVAHAATAARAATVKCGSVCADLFNAKFGSADVSAVAGSRAVGQPLALAKAAAVPAQDFAVSDLGEVRHFYRLGLIKSSALNGSYGSDEVYEYQYVPARSFSDLCLGVVHGSTAVTLQRCGRTTSTLWIADAAAANGSYTPLISGTDTSAPAAWALTAAKVGAAFTITQLSKTGVPAKDQLWQTFSGVTP
jgi:hypothetical protein